MRPLSWDVTTDRRRAFLCLAALCTLAFAFQGTSAITSPDEGYYVGVSESMARTGDLLVPRLAYTPWLDKPPLSFWGVASGLSFFGRNEWGARAFHAICHILTTLLVYVLGRSMYGRACGFLAGVVYATSMLPFIAASVVTPDAPLTLATTAAFFCFWRSLDQAGRPVLWNVLMCAALGLAFLTKGPAALMAAGAIVAFLVVSGQAAGYLRQTMQPVGLTVFCAIGLGWYAWVVREFPTAMAYIWRNQVVGRTVSGELHRNASPLGSLIYVPILLIGAFPWSIAWWPALRRGGRSFLRSPWRWAMDDPRRLLLAAWIVVPMLVLLLSRSRLPLYPLPVFPALALATSRCLGRRDAEIPATRSLMWPAVLWGLALIGLKLMLAIAPSARDMRALYAEMAPHLPADYEIVAVREHVEGLAFYTSRLVESVSDSGTPYPFFVAPERLEEEVGDLRTSDHAHAFLCRRKVDARRVRRTLLRAGASFEEIPLSHGYLMFLARPSGGDVATRIVFVENQEGVQRSRRITVASAIRLLHAGKALGGVVVPGAAPVELPLAEMREEGVPFHFVPDGPCRGAECAGRRYYSRPLRGGLVELFVLDADALNDGDPEQVAWLERALLVSRARWRIVAMNHPVLLPPLARADGVSSLETVMIQGGVAVVFEGSGLRCERWNGDAVAVERASTKMLPAPSHGPYGHDGAEPAFDLLECDQRACHVAAFDSLSHVVDHATAERPAR